MGADTTFFQELIKHSKKIRREIKTIEKNAIALAATYIQKDINEIFEQSVTEFYDAYTPRYYHRTYALYDAYRIKATSNSIKIQADGSLMPAGIHRASNDYIFDLAFVQGYHGGAFTDALGGDEPLWRVPPLTVSLPPGIKPYTDWGSPAVQTESPDEKAYRKLIAYELSGTVNTRMAQAYRQVITRYF